MPPQTLAHSHRLVSDSSAIILRGYGLGFHLDRAFSWKKNSFFSLIHSLKEIMAYAAMKPTKPGAEEAPQLHRIRITLSSKNVKNLEKGITLLRSISRLRFI